MRSALILGICVCAAVAPYGVYGNDLSFRDGKDYVGYLERVSRNTATLQKLISHGELNITDPRRHYIVIVGVLGCVAEYLNSDCTPPEYDNEYLPVVDRLLPVIWQNPEVAMEKMDKFVKNVNSSAQSIQNLVNSFCRSLSPATCNHIIATLLFFREDLRYPAEVLEAAASLATVYEDNTYEEEAKNYKEVPLLINGKETFRQLIFRAAHTYKLLYGKRCYIKKR